MDVNTVTIAEIDLDFNIWGDTAEVKEKTPVIYEYSDDPLALVCAMKRHGKYSHEIHDTIMGIGLKSYNFDNVIELSDRTHADEVRKHFKNSILMRRLKGLHISKFMIAVEQLVDEPKKLDVEHIKILVKLPDFYKESKETDALFSRYKSLNENNKVISFDGVISFAGKVKRVSKRENQTRYYFKTEDNNLISIFIQSSDQSGPVWDYISKKDKIKLKADLCIGKQPGHEFNFYRIAGTAYEFSEVNN